MDMSKPLIALLTLIGIFSICLGNSKAFAAASPVAQTYNAESSVLPGMLVRLNPSATQELVSPLTNKTLNKMLGVVIPASGSPIVLTPTAPGNQEVVVAGSGRYNVLVSSQNGPIKIGDQLTISALEGVAMKATQSQPQVVGQAEGNFNGYSNVIGTETVQNSNGKVLKEEISSISVNVNLGANPNYQPDKSILPQFVITGASKIANKQVSNFHIVLAAVAIVITVIISSSLFFGGASSRINAIGRNPLAKFAVGRALLSIVSFGIIVFVAGILLSYLILRL
jgi:hypothetical protein